MINIYSRFKVPGRYQTPCPGETMTQQHFKDDCDVNKILRKFAQTGTLPQLTQEPVYADVSALGSYQEQLNNVLTGQAVFDGFPAEIRARFENDPGRFFAWLSDPANVQEAKDIGILWAQPSESVEPVGETQPTTAPLDVSGGTDTNGG